MDDKWKNATPRGTVEYTMTGSKEAGFVYSAQLEGSDILTQSHNGELSREEVETLFADDFEG